MSISLKAGSLYAILYYRGDRTSWHWAFFLPSTTSSGSADAEGTLYHCRNDPNTNVWAYEVKPKYNPARSREGVVLIAALDDLSTFGTPTTIHSTLLHAQFSAIRVKQGATRAEFDCQTWFVAAMRALFEYGIVNCRSADKVDKELQLKALQATPAFERNRALAFFPKLDNCSV